MIFLLTLAIYFAVRDIRKHKREAKAGKATQANVNLYYKKQKDIAKQRENDISADYNYPKPVEVLQSAETPIPMVLATITKQEETSETVAATKPAALPNQAPKVKNTPVQTPQPNNVKKNGHTKRRFNKHPLILVGVIVVLILIESLGYKLFYSAPRAVSAPQYTENTHDSNSGSGSGGNSNNSTTIPQRLTARDSMSSVEFDAMMKKGLEQAKKDDSLPASEVFEKLRAEI